jgi:hypothetical protein
MHPALCPQQNLNHSLDLRLEKITLNSFTLELVFVKLKLEEEEED